MTNMTCKYLSIYRDERLCGLNRHERPTEEDCRACQEAGKDKVGGLGDAVAAAIAKTQLNRLKRSDCGCKKRQDKLNNILKSDKE